MKIASAKTALAAALTTATALLCLTSAQAEQDQSGALIASFHGGIAPLKLPRTQPAPISVQMGGKIKTTDRSTPPKLERIILEINRLGVISTKGLATCSLSKLEAVSAATAKRQCKSAQVGHGNVTSRVSLPGQGAFASNGSLLAFNGTHKGHQAVFAQVESGPPLPLTYVIVFEVKSKGGTFGTELIGTLPPIASEYGYISAFDLSLGASYRYQGRKLSYASAACPAPQGFTQAVFPFAKASYEFADGKVLSAKLVRSCKVRGR